MKYLAILAVLIAGAADAQSLCNVQAGPELIHSLSGDWTLEGATSVETETISIVVPETESAIITDGTFAADVIDRWTGEPLTLEPGQVYDVDAVDDMLETAEVDWIADAVSLTPCGPEALPQMTGIFDNGDALTGQATLIPYFADQIVLIVEVETIGTAGLAFLTTAALLSRQTAAAER